MMKRGAHTLTILSVCSTLIYFSVYNRSVIHDFFASDDELDDQEVYARREFSASATNWTGSAAAWHRRKLEESPETSLRKLAPELFKNMPEPFSKKYTNPCWGGKRRPRYCLPYFFLIGMPKCGTTDLWNKLIAHPHIVQTSKEPHWWSRVRIPELRRGWSKLNEDPATYYTRFANALNNYASREKVDAKKLVVGDGSASTMWDNQHWKLFYPNIKRGPPHVNGELIVTLNPDALAIAILRNPADRLYSDYMYFNSEQAPSPEHFHDRVTSSITHFHACVKRLDLRTCTYSTSSVNHAVRIEVGLYSVYVGDWLSFFPRKRLKIITMEEWHENCLKALTDIFNFLDLEKMNIADVFRICKDEVKNTRPADKAQLGPMLPETRQILEVFYSPHNRDLSRLLRDDKFLWRGVTKDVDDYAD